MSLCARTDVEALRQNNITNPVDPMAVALLELASASIEGEVGRDLEATAYTGVLRTMAAANNGVLLADHWPLASIESVTEDGVLLVDGTDFMADLGITSPGRDRLLGACYEGLNLVSFLTFVSDECRAWTIPAGTEAVAAAGKIHSDMARGFIRAETVAFDDLRSAGGMKAAKAAGKVRLEGKSYIVRDGDVINFRFNV